MKVRDLVKLLASHDDEDIVICWEGFAIKPGFAVMDKAGSEKPKTIFQLPESVEDAIENPPAAIRTHQYARIAYAGDIELQALYHRFGSDWEMRFHYKLSYNFGNGWWHLFIDFRENSFEFGQERTGNSDSDLVKVPASEAWEPKNG